MPTTPVPQRKNREDVRGGTFRSESWKRLSLLHFNLRSTDFGCSRALGQVGALAWERREIMRLEAAISAQEAEIAKYRTLKTSVYEDLRDGLITQDEFLHMKQDFSERISFIEDDISGLKTELDAVRAGLVNQTGWLAQFRQYRNLAKLTRTVVVNLIDKIHIYPDKKITVTLLCKDQLTDVIAFLREQVQTQHAAEKEAG